ncbi:MAG: hypothetical protein QGD94_11750, partial [Planctomycetia bacterium]|nr:hypothetical protein [Planctomycetia bacterium]
NLYEHINRLNTVTACHFCNSLTSRSRGNEEIKKAIDRFTNCLSLPEPDRGTGENSQIQKWFTKLRNAIRNVWQEKSKRARCKLRWLRSHHKEEIECQLNLRLADDRLLVSPQELDERLDKIMDEISDGLTKSLEHNQEM